MTQILRNFALAISLAGCLWLGACQQQEAEEPAEAMEETMEEAGDAAEETVEEAGEAMEEVDEEM